MFELIHTSAPRGLFGGSGYTTVAATSGIPESLRKALESLSGYEQAFEYGSARYSANPPAFICQPIGQAAGKSWWVLSRIVVADKDYTGRSNYLAHHVALEHHELPQAGPVAMALSFPWMEAWTGEPRHLPVRAMAPIAAYPSPASAPSWSRAGLDPGWAGHLAEQARSRRGGLLLVYPAGADPLALAGDAVALLPPMERWDARFHTHTSRPRPEHAWAWFPSEGPGSADLAGRPGVVHLSLRPACPGSGSLVDMARGLKPLAPVPGGTGPEAFHGPAAGRAVLPVATAVATAGDGRPAVHHPAGSWHTPPIPEKAQGIGVILHWTAHGLLLLAVVVLAWFVVGDIILLGRQKTQLDELKGEKTGLENEIGEKNKQLKDLNEFKTALHPMDGFLEADWQKAGNKALLVSPVKSRELKDMISRIKFGEFKVITARQLAEEKAAIDGKAYLVEKQELIAIRDRMFKDSDEARAFARKNEELAMEKAKADKELAAIKAKPAPLDWQELQKAVLDKEGAVDIRFQLGPTEGKWLNAAAAIYGKDPMAMRSLNLLALGIKPKEYFPVGVLRRHATGLSSKETGESWWKGVFDKVNDLTGGKREGLPASAASMLFQFAAVEDLIPEGSGIPPQADPSVAAWFRQVDSLRKNDKSHVRAIRSKLEEIENR